MAASGVDHARRDGASKALHLPVPLQEALLVLLSGETVLVFIHRNVRRTNEQVGSNLILQ